VTARRQFGAAIVACVAGAGLVLLALRQGWARVEYTVPKPLPSGSITVTGQELLPAAGALALAALACLAAIIATRGLARRVAGLALAGLGAWIAAEVSQPVHAATVIAAASGQAVSGGLGGSLPGGNSAIGGGSSAGGALPEIGAASRVVLDSGAWRPLAVVGAAAVIAAGLLAAWRGPRWAVMSARFDRSTTPASPESLAPVRAPESAAPSAPVASSASTAPSATTDELVPAEPGISASPITPVTSATSGSRAGAAAVPGSAASGRAPASAGPAVRSGPAAWSGPAGNPEPAGAEATAAQHPDGAEATAAQHPDGDAAALWEALDRGVDLTDTGGAAEAVGAPARVEEL
jgi:hypothetical protein